MKNDAGEWIWLPVDLIDPHNMCAYAHTDYIYGKYDTSDTLQVVGAKARPRYEKEVTGCLGSVQGERRQNLP
jgi:hypothetical protein